MNKTSKSSPVTDYISYGYALAILIGGLMGYVKAGSILSLGAGLIFGSAAAFGAYQVSSNPRNFILAFLASGALLAVMGLRFYNGGKFMPAGLMTILSLIQVIRLGSRFFQKNNTN